jgi:hypothetical protein
MTRSPPLTRAVRLPPSGGAPAAAAPHVTFWPALPATSNPAGRPAPGSCPGAARSSKLPRTPAAVDGQRSEASDYISEAHATATRLGRNANHRFTAFGPANVTLYQVSIAQVLGDSGTAIQHASKLNLAAIPTAERRGRFWIDVARAYHQWGKPEACYRALLAAERAAPGEVRYRPPVHRITEDLLRADRRTALPELASFARRIGIPHH